MFYVILDFLDSAFHDQFTVGLKINMLLKGSRYTHVFKSAVDNVSHGRLDIDKTKDVQQEVHMLQARSQGCRTTKMFNRYIPQEHSAGERKFQKKMSPGTFTWRTYCGHSKHSVHDCCFRGYKCHNCNQDDSQTTDDFLSLCKSLRPQYQAWVVEVMVGSVKLDMEIDTEATISQELCTVNMHRGLFHYIHLPFGIKSHPAIFQRTMEQMLQGLESDVCFQDDILVTGSTREQHVRNLRCMLQRLSDNRLTVNQKKGKFFLNYAEFLGHIVDREGLHLQTWLGLVNNYAKFLPNISTILAPLHALL
ncbi:hypothetical protein PR048_001136 [Dryococelus australis]|uniref:Reverse transcriptase domain-containing protein n=1 Tax=Dryococelus australis TaxID=614101 RepID=A0ABQ9IGJ3_9NEOP|nr:hypothetical protein PR048_001136 [Dryococelus australis]